MTPSWRIGWEAADPPRTPVLFVNPRSGGGAAARARVAERAREQGIEVVELGGDQDLRGLVDQPWPTAPMRWGWPAGRLSCGRRRRRLCARTAFHLCTRWNAEPLRSGPRLGSRRSCRWLEAFGDGVEVRIDLGEVNGRSFLNLVSLGVYGEAVQRSGYRDAKARTLLETAHAVLGPSWSRARAEPRGRSRGRAPPSAHRARLQQPLLAGAPDGSRRPPRLDGGRLGIIVIDAPAGPRRPPGRAWNARSLEVAAPSTIHAGVDGEAVELAPPLRFSIRPRALRVRVPRLDTARWRPRRPARARRR